MPEQTQRLDREKIGDYVTIYRRGSRWYANFQIGRKQKRHSLKTTSVKEARRRAIKLEAGLHEGNYHSQRTPPSIKAVTDAYIQTMQAEVKAEKTLAKVTLVARRLNKLAVERNARTIIDVDLQFVDAFRERRLAAGNGPKTILNQVVIIRQIVNFALSRRLITDDPLAGIKLKKVKSSPQPCWTRAEVDQILATTSGWHRNVMILLAETGMRVGEAKWLTWADVDIDSNVFHIREKPGWRPKTGDQRAVPMNSFVRELVARLPRTWKWLLTQPHSKRCPRDGRQISERRLLSYLKTRLRRLGLRGKVHTFRHAFISNALINGVPEAVLRSWVGHVDAEIMRLYTHIHDTASQAAMEKLAGKNLSAISTKTTGRCSSSSPRRPGRGEAHS